MDGYRICWRDKLRLRPNPSVEQQEEQRINCRQSMEKTKNGLQNELSTNLPCRIYKVYNVQQWFSLLSNKKKIKKKKIIRKRKKTNQQETTISAAAGRPEKTFENTKIKNNNKKCQQIATCAQFFFFSFDGVVTSGETREQVSSPNS